MIDLKGRRAFVTGAAAGIGRATASVLAEAGAHVVASDMNAAGLDETVAMIADAGGKAEAMVLDVTDTAAIDATAEAAIADGAPDVLVNVAGWDRQMPFLENTPDFIEKIVQLNYLGQVRVCRAFLPAMIGNGGGRIVNVSSDAGRVGSAGETVYAGAKGGVIAFSKSLAREMARHTINVNVVCPGPTDTALLQDQSERYRDALVRAIPFRRFAEPAEVADAILFFASDRARYVTGQVLSVSGGLTMAG